MIDSTLGAPVRAREASQLAELIFQFCEGRSVDDALRRMLASRANMNPFESLQVHWGSLAPDPSASSTYYIAADGTHPLLLHIALGAAPASGLFSGQILIGRMRTPRGMEVVVNAIPFSENDADRIEIFANEVDRSLLPGPQGTESLYIAARRDPATAFGQFRAVHRKYGITVAAWAGEPHAGLWGAIRSGWRDGLPMSGGRPYCTRVCLDAASHDGLDAAFDAVRALHGRNFDIDIDLAGSSSRPTRPADLDTLLARFRAAGRGPKVAFVNIGLRPDGSYPRSADEMPDWPDDILSSVEWRTRGKTLVELRQRIEDLQNAARRYGAIIGLRPPAPLADEVLEAIAAGADRRLWFDLGDNIPSSEIATIASHLRS